MAVTAPLGQVWPGLAASRETVTNPEQLASEFAEAFLTGTPRTHLGLVAAPSGAEALTAVGCAGLATTKATPRNSLRSSGVGNTDSEPVSAWANRTALR